MNAKIKVAAPRVNPHICYIGRDYQSKIESIKSATGMSLYNLLRICSGKELNTQESIKEFKFDVKKNGFKNIGEWAEALIDILYDNIEDINMIELSSIKVKKTKGEE